MLLSTAILSVIAAGSIYPQNSTRGPVPNVNAAWESVDDVFASGDHDKIDIFEKLTDYYSRELEKLGENPASDFCIQSELDSSAAEKRREVTLDDLLGRYRTIVHGVVLDAVPGLKNGVTPSSLLDIRVEGSLRGAMEEQIIRYEIQSFEASLPNGDYLCYQQGSIRVPKPGTEVVLFLSEAHGGQVGRQRLRTPVGAQADLRWTAGLDDILIGVSAQGLSAPGFLEKKLNEAFRRRSRDKPNSDLSPRDWLVNLVSEEEERS